MDKRNKGVVPVLFLLVMATAALVFVFGSRSAVQGQGGSAGKYQFFSYHVSDGNPRICVGDTATGDAMCADAAVSGGKISQKSKQLSVKEWWDDDGVFTVYHFHNPFALKK